MMSSHASNAPAGEAVEAPRVSAEAIDASCRWPVTFLFVCAACWLVVGGALALLGSIKAHAPGLLAACPWLTYGRVQPAAWHALVYGFASQAALGAALWMTARLSGTVLFGGRGILVFTLFWNLGLKLGLLGILAGHGTGVEGLEFPRYAAPILLVAYLGIAVWAVVTFRQRRCAEVYVSQWYLLGALFSFPWVFAAAQIMAVCLPLRGVLHVAVGAWYLQNLFALWLGFVGLAAVFYLIPKLTGKAVPSRNLALFGFWTLALFGGLGGLVRYQGGPFPTWMTSLGVVAVVMTVFPAAAVGMNLWPLCQSPGTGKTPEPALAFARWGLLAYLAGAALSAINAFGTLRQVTQFTLVTPGLDHLFLFGFVSLALWGVMYHAIPQLLGSGWPTPRWVGMHLKLALGGAGLLVAAELLGGWAQAGALQDPQVQFVGVVKRYVPFVGLGTLAWMVLLAGHLLFLVHLARALWLIARAQCLPAVKAFVTPMEAEGKA